MRWRWPIAILVAAGLAAAAFLTWPDGAEAALLRADDPDVVAIGRAVYAARCASCHGADLEGQADWRSPGPDGLLSAPPHDERGHTWHHPDRVLFELTKYGTAAVVGADYDSAMPPYEDVLSDEEIVAVLSFIKSRWPDRIRRRQDEINARSNE